MRVTEQSGYMPVSVGLSRRGGLIGTSNPALSQFEEKAPDIRVKKERLKNCETELSKVEKELGLTNDSLNHSGGGGGGAVDAECRFEF